MVLSKFRVKQALGVVLLSSGLLLGFPEVSRAECSGLTLWSGLDERDDELKFCWDYDMRPGQRERYRFHVPAEKIPEGVSKIRISYEDRYKGQFDPDNMDLRVDGESLPREALEIYWEEEAKFVEIGVDFAVLEDMDKNHLKDALEEGHSLEVVFHYVRNPRFGGMFYFSGSFIPANGVEPWLDLGAWIVTVSRY